MSETIGHAEQIRSELEAKKALLSGLLREGKLNEFSTPEMIEQGAQLQREIESLQELLNPHQES